MDDDFFGEEIDERTPEQERSEIARDVSKSEDEAHGAILEKAQKNVAKCTKEDVHRTLADIQPLKKKHWWERSLG